MYTTPTPGVIVKNKYASAAFPSTRGKFLWMGLSNLHTSRGALNLGCTVVSLGEILKILTTGLHARLIQSDPLGIRPRISTSDAYWMAVTQSQCWEPLYQHWQASGQCFYFAVVLKLGHRLENIKASRHPSQFYRNLWVWGLSMISIFRELPRLSWAACWEAFT